jgi:uncharacterized protein DUF465
MKSRRAANDYQSSSEKAAVLRGDAHTLIQLVVSQLVVSQLVVSQLVVSQFEFWMALISRSAPASYMIGARWGAEALAHSSTDDLKITELKRRKLILKDEIERVRHDHAL